MGLIWGAGWTLSGRAQIEQLATSFAVNIYIRQVRVGDIDIRMMPHQYSGQRLMATFTSMLIIEENDTSKPSSGPGPNLAPLFCFFSPLAYMVRMSIIMYADKHDM